MSTLIAISTLVRAYNLQNATVLIDDQDNPYDGKIDQSSSVDPELYKSTLGTPVITDLTLEGGTYTPSVGPKITFQDVVLQTVLVMVSQAKKIIVTDIQGRDGTVKEYIGLDDYQVTINGIITGPNGHYPQAEVNTLHQLAKAPIPIKVISRYLQNFDIFNLVIKDFAYEQEPGGYSKQNFTLNCISDAPIELQIV